MREIPVLNRQVIEQSHTGIAFLAFVTISHPEMTVPFRFVLDGADYVIDGATFYKSFFELELLTDTDQPPTARFRFPNVDRAAMSRLQAVANPPRVSIDLIASTYFDLTVEPRIALAPVEYLYRARRLFLTDITADAIQVEGTLRSFDYRLESWPNKRATQALLPGVYVR